MTEKKEWNTPALRIFTRSRAEEHVLTACKGDSVFGPQNSGCVHNGMQCGTLGNS